LTKHFCFVVGLRDNLLGSGFCVFYEFSGSSFCLNDFPDSVYSGQAVSLSSSFFVCVFWIDGKWAYKTVGLNLAITWILFTVQCRSEEMKILVEGSGLDQAYTIGGLWVVFAGGHTRPGLACPPKADRFRRRAADTPRSNP